MYKIKVKLVKNNGMMHININGEDYSPIAFRSFRPEKRNITDFYNSGIRLMSILVTGLKCTLGVPYSTYGEIWKGIREYDMSALDKQIELFIKNAPGAYFNIMIQLDTRQWYLEKNPECSDTYWNLVEMAGYGKWRKDTGEFLTYVIEYIEKKYGKKVFSYSILCGTSTEWYTNSQHKGKKEGQIRKHLIKEKCYKEYIDNPEAVLPDIKELRHTADGVFRHPVNDEKAVSYWKFHNNIIGDTILYFSTIIKNTVGRKKLLGLFYGYLLELTSTRLLYEGHMGYEKVWDSKDIDMIFAPASYGEVRSFEGTSAFLLNIDSLYIKDKLYFHEVDHRTFIAPETIENSVLLPGLETKPKNLFETIMILRREFVMCMVKRAGLWWFDFFGGEYCSNGLMDAVSEMVKIRERLKEMHMETAAEIAVFGDVESMYYVSETSEINKDNIRCMRDNFNRLGTPYDIFNFSDIDNPALKLGQYKLCIFLNVFKISEEKRKFIQKNVKCRGRSVLWLYAPGYISDETCAEKNISDLIDINVKKLTEPGLNIEVECKDILTKVPSGTKYGFTNNIAPMFYIRDKDAVVLGNYVNRKEGALGYKKLRGYYSFYSAAGNMPCPVIREIARFSGVHIYYEGNDPVYVNNRLLGIHSISGGETRFAFQSEVEAEELFSGGYYKSKNNCLEVKITEGEVKLFLLKSI